MRVLIEVLSLGVAAGVAAHTITKTTITLTFRQWLSKKNKWLGTLFTCPNCLSHWLCAIAVLIYRPRFLDMNIVLDLGVTWLVMIFISSLAWGTIQRQIMTLVPRH